jgi:hypothetical protein
VSAGEGCLVCAAICVILWTTRELLLDFRRKTGRGRRFK